ncbi:MAG: hypothetical protein AB8G22_06545, partial [Saprospiraceae bacterium]
MTTQKWHYLTLFPILFLLSATLFAQPANDECDTPPPLTIYADQANCVNTSGTTVGAQGFYQEASCTTSGATVSNVWYRLNNTVNYPHGITIEVSNFSGQGIIGVAFITRVGSTCLEATTEGFFGELECSSSTNSATSVTYFDPIYDNSGTAFFNQILVWSEGSDPADAGTFDICVYANPPAPDEICDNEIDDDNDGKVDCDDNECGRPIDLENHTVVHPTCPYKDNGSITFDVTGNNLRYNLNNAGWVSSPTFTDLSPGGPYTLIAENETTGCSIEIEVFLDDENCPPVFATDDCAPAIEMAVNGIGGENSITATIDNTNATYSQSSHGNPCGFSSYQGGDMWVKFKAPATGFVRFQPIVNNWVQGYGVAVYDDCSVNTYIACKGDFGTDFVNFYGLIPDKIYHLRAWEKFGVRSGILEFALNTITPPDYDVCVGAVNITVADTRATCMTTVLNNSKVSSSTPINGTPSCGVEPDGDLWIKFTTPAAPFSGSVKMLVEGNDWTFDAA